MGEFAPAAPLWKQVIAGITRVDTEGEDFSPERVWEMAWARFERKALAYQEKQKTKILRAESKFIRPPDFGGAELPLAPLVTAVTEHLGS